MFEYKAIIRSVHDGDTFRADVDLGFDVWLKNIPFRLNRINAPELSSTDPAGRLARDQLRFWLPVGATVFITTEKDKEEKYGRMLADVWTLNTCLNDLMVENGFAKYWDGKGLRP